MNKKAQSEFIGFAVIIIIVSILILIFLSFMLNKSPEKDIQNYETESFLQSALEYTTTCAKYSEPNFLPVRSLIYYCLDEKNCSDNKNSCEVLNQTLKDLVGNSWKTGENWPAKGYELIMMYQGEEFLQFSAGNLTNKSKGSSQHYDRDVDLLFTVYS